MRAFSQDAFILSRGEVFHLQNHCHPSTIARKMYKKGDNTRPRCKLLSMGDFGVERRCAAWSDMVVRHCLKVLVLVLCLA